MKVRWGNILAIGVLSLAIMLALKAGPWLREVLKCEVFRPGPRTTVERLFVFDVLLLLIFGVVIVVKLIVQGRRDR